MKYRHRAPWLYPVGRYFILPVLRRIYSLRAVNAELVRDLDPPYVIVANHSTYYDGFFLGCAVPHRVYLLVTDSLLHGALGFLLRRAGVIPLTKNLPSVDSVRKMTDLIRHDRVVGMFPEGQTTWHGASGPIPAAVGKLIKLLGVPVVAVRIAGGYHTEPKWSRKKRVGAVTVEYSLAADSATVAERTGPELTELVQAAISHDDDAYVRENDLKFPSDRGAEYLERVLYRCRECGVLARLRSQGNTFRCEACGAEWHWTDSGVLLSPESGTIVTIREWFREEKRVLAQVLEERLAVADAGPVYPSDAVVAWKGFRTAPRVRLGRGNLTATASAYVFDSAKHGRLVFPLSELSGCQVMEANQFEFYYAGHIHVFMFSDPAASGLKYLHILQIRNPDAAEMI